MNAGAEQQGGIVPSGTVTFFFSDIQGSTRLWAADEAGMSASTQLHEQIIRGVLEPRGGYVFNTAGDSFAVAFESAELAVDAAQTIQEALAATEWPGPSIRVRIGLHRGLAEVRDCDYFGINVNTAARIEDAGHGGQTLASQAVVQAAGIDAQDMGIYQLRDLAEPVHLFQLGDGDFPPLRVADPELHNLPARPTSIIGREVEVAHLRGLLLEERLVTMTALGGCGKTRLALAVGEAELRHQPDGVWFVDFTAIVDGANVPAALAEAAGLSLGGGDPTEQVITYFAGKESLLILDNCEHIIDDVADFVDAWLQVPGRSRILATSREPLDLDGERVMMLESLPFEGSDSPAVRLFAERATAIQPTFMVTDANRADVEAICRHLDGIPLAVELAAVRMTAMTPAEVLAGLDDRFTLLGGGRRRRRMRTLRATLDWSYDNLVEDDQRVFRCLGAFVDGFDLPAVEAITALPTFQARDALDSLQSKSMIVRAHSGEHARFRMLETVKAYADERQQEEGGAAGDRGRHLAHFHERATRHGRVCQGLLSTGNDLRRDTSNLSAAFDWAMDQGEHAAAGELLLGTSMAFFMSTRVLEFRTMLLEAEKHVGNDDPELLDYLTVQLVFGSGKLRDLAGVEHHANLLLESEDPGFRAVGHATLASLAVRRSPGMGSAPDLFSPAWDELDRGGGDRDGNIAEFAPAYVATAELTRSLIALDLAAALERADEVLSAAADHGSRSFLHVGVANSQAMALLLSDRPADALAALDWLVDHALPYYDGVEARTLIRLEQGDIEAAKPDLRVQCQRGLSGRFEGECCDSVLLLATLAHAEGDDDRARALLTSMGQGRLPATVAFARHLGARLDVAPAPETSIDDALGTLRTEMNRRGWS